MALTFLQIANNICDRRDVPQAGTLVGSDINRKYRRLREHINLAYNQIMLDLGLKNESKETTTTLTTVAGTQSYAIPSGLLSVSQLRIGNDPPLEHKDWVSFERYTSDTFLITTTGYPAVYSIYERKIHLYPVPDTAFTINVRGFETHTDLAADDDEPDLPTDFHRAIQELAMYYEMAYENNPQAGMLSNDSAGRLQAQGGQAAVAVQMLNAAKARMRSHDGGNPRIISEKEASRQHALRRVIRG